MCVELIRYCYVCIVKLRHKAGLSKFVCVVSLSYNMKKIEEMEQPPITVQKTFIHIGYSQHRFEFFQPDPLGHDIFHKACLGSGVVVHRYASEAGGQEECLGLCGNLAEHKHAA